MEIAVCTRCQSSNPIFTKFCLTCGLGITSEMKRSVTNTPIASKMSPTATVAVSNQPVATTQTQTGVQAEQPTNQPQTKGTGWLKSLFSK